MPELPEVEATRNFALWHTRGKIVKEVVVQEDAKVFQGKQPDEIREVLAGRKITGVERKGKHFWFVFDGGNSLCLHLGMAGSLQIEGKSAPKYVRIKDGNEWPPRFTKLELVLEDGTRVALTDGRRFAKVFTSADPLNEEPISKLGKDSYTELPGEEAFCALLATHRRSIKAVLLDQAVLCGIGNWVADEVLYQAKLYPEKAARDLEKGEMKALRAAIESVLTKAVEVDADAARLPREWLFHYRWTGKTASQDANGEAIKFLTVGGRTTAYVPSVQLKSGPGKKEKVGAKKTASSKKKGAAKKAESVDKASSEGASEEASVDEGDEGGAKKRAPKRKVEAADRKSVV